MNIATSQPLGAYITERELSRTADRRVFELLLPWQLEGSKQATMFRWRWTYPDAQSASDVRIGIIDGQRARHALEKQAFIRQVLRELMDHGEKLYSVDGQQIPVRGKGQ